MLNMQHRFLILHQLFMIYFLSKQNIVHYLLEKGLLQKAQLVSGQYSVGSVHSRNNNFVIEQGINNEQYFIKQVIKEDPFLIDTLRMEAAIYWLSNEHSQFEPLKTLLPKLYDYDYDNHILIIEHLKNYQSLHQLQEQLLVFDTAIAKQIGKSLAQIHIDIYTASQEEKAGQLFKKILPWIFFFGRDGVRNQPETTNASKQLESLILSDENYCEAIKQNGQKWEPNCLIHGDIKWSNILIENVEKGKKIKIVDWETADFGDPCWDIAGVLQNYLSNWAFAAQQNEAKRKKAFDKTHMQLAIQAFWNSYCEEKNTTIREQKIMLSKSFQFAALRLLQTCIEASSYQQNLEAKTAGILQLTKNILLKSDELIFELLGIDIKQ